MTVAGKMLLGVVVLSAVGFLAWVVGGAGFGRWGAWSYYLFCAGAVMLIAGGVGTVVALLTAILEVATLRASGDPSEEVPAERSTAQLTLLFALLAVAVAAVGACFAMKL